MKPLYLAITAAILLTTAGCATSSRQQSTACNDAHTTSNDYWDEAQKSLTALRSARDAGQDVTSERSEARERFRLFAYVIQQNPTCYTAKQRVDAQRFLDIPPIETSGP